MSERKTWSEKKKRSKRMTKKQSGEEKGDRPESYKIQRDYNRTVNLSKIANPAVLLPGFHMQKEPTGFKVLGHLFF